jgi:isochorismate synthase
VSVARDILARIEAAAGSGSGIESVRLHLRDRPDDIDWFGELRGERDHFYWRCPVAGVRLVGIGAVRVVAASGATRFDDASSAVRACMEGVRVVGDDGPVDRGPLALGAFEFADGSAARFVFPEILLVEKSEELWLTYTRDPRDAAGSLRSSALPLLESLFDAEPATVVAQDACGFDRDGPRGMESGPEYRVQSDRSHADYRAQVDHARNAIAAGELEKVVVARSLRVTHKGRFELPSLLRRLERLYPTCVTFAVSHGETCFLAATPELLVARDGAAVRSGAVAGSSRRGRTPEEDERLGRALRESKKEQEEHGVVVREIAASLAGVCARLEVSESPRLLRIEGIQHLETPIEGVLEDVRGLPSVIDLAGRLHPTPAVGGAPRAAALAWIARSEGLDRHGYAAPVGFVDRDGGGEFRVALRSALVRAEGDTDVALLFAGAGIVADSQPARELEETRIKLRALLAPMTEI